MIKNIPLNLYFLNKIKNLNIIKFNEKLKQINFKTNKNKVKTFFFIFFFYKLFNLFFYYLKVFNLFFIYYINYYFINIILLNINLSNFLIFMPLLLILVFNLFYFFNLNFSNININKYCRDKILIKTHTLNKLYSNINLVFFFLVSFFFFFVFFFSFRYYEYSFWWNHFTIINSLINNMNISLFFFFITFFLVFNLNNFFYLKLEYLYSIFLLLIFSLYLFLVNNYYSFIFLIETMSITILLKFVSSKIWNNNNLKSSLNKITLKHIDSNKKYLNVLFFHFWSSFFSTIFLFLFFFYLIYNYSTTEWIFLNYFFFIKNSFFNFNCFNNLIFFFFLISFLLKLGITPFHLYKIEIYKGLPFISIYFYTTVFFFFYFNFFFYLIYVYFYSFTGNLYIFTMLISIISLIYVLTQMFELNFSKSFFAYSTILNSLLFFLFILLIAN